MIGEIQIIFVGTVLALVMWTICLIHLYRKERLRAETFREYIDIKRCIEQGKRADKILWNYYDVAYLNDSYNIKLKAYNIRAKELKR